MKEADNFDQLEQRMKKEVLKYAVQRLVFCPTCEHVLDMRKVTEVDLQLDGKTLRLIYTCNACYDALKGHLDNVFQEQQAKCSGTLSLVITDSRDLYRGKGHGKA